jgi:glycolate oxidase FAD binding subunit
VTDDRVPDWRLIAAFEEKNTTVEWQLATLSAELKAAPLTRSFTHGGPEGVAFLLQKVSEEAAGRYVEAGESRFGFRATVRPSDTAAFCTAAKSLRPDLHLHAEGLNGIVSGHVTADLKRDDAVVVLDEFTRLASGGGGSVVVRRCPAAWKKSLPVWGRPTPAWELMRQVKTALDPDNVFNPGRLFGDL